MSAPSHITHVLVDGARYPDALRRLYARDDLAEIEPLYLLTRFKDLAEQGPILVAPRDRRFVDEILAEGDGERTRAMSLLSSPASTGSLSDHLLGFVEIESEGAPRLLRFADPLVLRHWLASHGERVPVDIMGPIRSWRVAHWAPAWNEEGEPAWQAFEAAEHPTPGKEQASKAPAMLAAPQRDALDAVARWQFKERLSAHFERNAAVPWSRLASAMRGDWLEARLDDALVWGAQTERQLAIWAELALHWGADFVTATDGPYARWVAGDASRGRLPRQQQLYTLDDWCRSGKAHQENGHRTTRTSSHV
ncbi:DUF4123 domain-containing protein [Halomonas borealis]|uniref:DUF4123 domain-containing protein n=1 Tax=Halomonas borealis TaxID=2508710 RepID=UPI00109F68F4|nr:DUF4123 domain-containing protein [Halomonas borealis]